MAEPIVFVPGLMCDARVFAPQIAALSQYYTVQVANVTGHETIEDCAKNLLVSAPGRFALAGHSFGALVAMEVMRRAPDRVSRIAIMNASPLPERPGVAEARADQMAQVEAGELERVLKKVVPADALASKKGKTQILEDFHTMALELGAEVFLRQMSALINRPDQQEAMQDVTAPGLILGGGHDTVCVAKRLEFLSSLMPNASLKIFKSAGHLPMLESPKETNQALREWMGEPLLLT